jgi:hypothetical protein
MSEKKQKKQGAAAGLKESFRKFLVALKRNPQSIPLTMSILAFVVYSGNLTSISNTTAKIQSAGMGLAEFCIMLFSLLSIVCLMNAFPRRKKANVPMVVLMYAMYAVILVCEMHYMSCIDTALTRAESPIVLSTATSYIADAYNMLAVHMVLLVVCGVLVATLPLYSKLLKKINTSIQVESNNVEENAGAQVAASLDLA